jgi:GINS complex subunit 3
MRELDVDVILSEEERLPCTFLTDATNLGHLDNTIVEKDLPAQTRVDLPLWLCRTFAKKEVVQMEFPKYYGIKMREELHAGADAVDLRAFTQYFFEVGVVLAAEMTKSDLNSRRDLMNTLRNAFTGERYRRLTMNSLAQGLFDDAADYSQTLTVAELNLFQQGLNAAKNMHQWRSLDSDILQKASVLGRRSAGVPGGGADKRARTDKH